MKATMAALAAAVMSAAAIVLAAPAQAVPTYGSNGVFGVDTEAGKGWVTAFIAPGRYRVDQAPSMAPYQSAPGFWLRCNAFPCSHNAGGHIIARGDAVRGVATFVDILPTDTAVALYNTTLTRA
jgi:hypothetical protein